MLLVGMQGSMRLNVTECVAAFLCDEQSKDLYYWANNNAILRCIIMLPGASCARMRGKYERAPCRINTGESY